MRVLKSTDLMIAGSCIRTFSKSGYETLTSGFAAGERESAAGPLEVSKENPRYFADPSGSIVYLTGSHTWMNLTEQFDWPRYLDFLSQRHHNFIRLWSLENPWPRSGPDEALDGKPRFDLNRFEQSYFDRLRERIQSAGRRGIYVSVMLFEGFGMQFAPDGQAWAGHPFNSANNANAVDGDPDGAGRGLAMYTLDVPAVTRVQEAYVRKVIDTVGDLDNVLYEVCNEAGAYSTEWQHHIIRFVKECEATRAKQHPIGMTYQHAGGTNQALFDSPADWISPTGLSGPEQAPEGYNYKRNPPPADASKVILSDTDHLWGASGGNQAWVWKSFCRGLNPIFMDLYLHEGGDSPPAADLDPEWDPVRDSMGYTRRFAERMDLAKARPSEQIASSGYCLAVPGEEYFVYLPEGGSVTVELSAVSGQMQVEWFDPSLGKTHSGQTTDGGGRTGFEAPFSGDAVLYLKRP